MPRTLSIYLSLSLQNLMKISAERRLLLTGTPLQNNLLELMSLLCFVMPEIFQGKTDHLKKVFTMISRHDEKKKSRFERDRIAHAKRIMKPFVLRRLKKDVLSQLPPKTEHMERCSMLPAQQVSPRIRSRKKSLPSVIRPTLFFGTNNMFLLLGISAIYW